MGYKAVTDGGAAEKALSPLNNEAIKEKMAELNEASMPLIEYLYKYGDPYTAVTVTMDSVRVSQDTMGIPLEVRD